MSFGVEGLSGGRATSPCQLGSTSGFHAHMLLPVDDGITALAALANAWLAIRIEDMEM